MLLSTERVQSPTREGPNVPPASPAKANSAKRAVPPVGMRAEVKLIAPGHMIPTARPLIIQPVRMMRGTEAKDAVKYATKQRAPAPSIYADKSSFSPFLPYQSRPSPMQNAKPQGPAKSPIDLSTPKDSSAKADVHCAIVASEAPAAIIRTRKSQKMRFPNNCFILILSASCTMGSMGQKEKLTML